MLDSTILPSLFSFPGVWLALMIYLVVQESRFPYSFGDLLGPRFQQIYAEKYKNDSETTRTG